jgi:phage terminase large subunit-like protein
MNHSSKRSLAELLASVSDLERTRLLDGVDWTPDLEQQLLYCWDFWARPDQIMPPGDWTSWLILAGRGWGKTRTGSEAIRKLVCGDTPHAPGRYKRIALIAETAADARDVMVEGGSGIIAVHPKDWQPTYEPSKRRLTWPNGAVATLYNATEPDQLRGPEHDLAYCDELAKWRYAQETWDMMQFGLRLGNHPKVIITTTPRPLPIIKKLMADPDTITTRGSTYANRANLAPSFIRSIEDRYEGTRLGRQEISAEVLDDAPGALWSRTVLDEKRVKPDALPDMQRVVVAIDPAASANDEGNAETGIICAGLGVDGRGYVLDDQSCRLSPLGWARRALATFDLNRGDCIVAELNQGGNMVEHTIRSAPAGWTRRSSKRSIPT